MSGIVDVIMWAGENNYSVSEFINEARKMGVSKRIPRNSIPEGIVPGRSRLFIKHKKAIVSGIDLDDLLKELNLYPFLPEHMLQLVMQLEQIREDDPEYFYKLVGEHELTWSPGVIGYSYISSIQYVVEEGEEGLPKDLAHIKYLEPVKMEYADGSNESKSSSSLS